MSKRLASEAIGSAGLLAIIVGSGIMGARLSGGNIALALLANSLATGAGLVALILAFPAAHLNPAVTMADAARGGTPWGNVPRYIAAQAIGAVLGVLLAHAMFALPWVTWSVHARTGGAQWLSEAVATFGLLAVIFGCSRHRPSAVPFAVAAYIVAAYWFTASTSFANPAVTLARAFTDSFAGIRPADVLGFVLAQCGGAAVAVVLFRWLDGRPTPGRLHV